MTRVDQVLRPFLRASHARNRQHELVRRKDLGSAGRRIFGGLGGRGARAEERRGGGLLAEATRILQNPTKIKFFRSFQ
jgi:hypothetical protein